MLILYFWTKTKIFDKYNTIIIHYELFRKKTKENLTKKDT